MQIKKSAEQQVNEPILKMLAAADGDYVACPRITLLWAANEIDHLRQKVGDAAAAARSMQEEFSYMCNRAVDAERKLREAQQPCTES